MPRIIRPVSVGLIVVSLVFVIMLLLKNHSWYFIYGGVLITEANVACTRMTSGNNCWGSIYYQDKSGITKDAAVTTNTIVQSQKTGETDGALLYIKKPIKAVLEIASSREVSKITILN